MSAAQSMRQCLIEALDGLRAALPGTTPQEWYDDGADVDVFLAVGGNVMGLRSWGYLQGAADHANQTVMELLGRYGLTLDGRYEVTHDGKPYAKAPPRALPPCVVSMGCACAFHTCGGDAGDPCDATERGAVHRARLSRRRAARRLRAARV